MKTPAPTQTSGKHVGYSEKHTHTHVPPPPIHPSLNLEELPDSLIISGAALLPAGGRSPPRLKEGGVEGLGGGIAQQDVAHVKECLRWISTVTAFESVSQLPCSWMCADRARVEHQIKGLFNYFVGFRSKRNQSEILVLVLILVVKTSRVLCA